MIILIAAVAENYVLGFEGALPWELPDDMHWFKTQTLNRPIIMGRKTFDALGKPLPKRLNIVISRHPQLDKDNLVWVSSVEKALAKAREATGYQNDDIMIIGGGDIYSQSMGFADRLYLTEIAASPIGDTYFPSFDKSKWAKKILEEYPAKDGQPAFIIAQYDRV